MEHRGVEVLNNYDKEHGYTVLNWYPEFEKV